MEPAGLIDNPQHIQSVQPNERGEFILCVRRRPDGAEERRRLSEINDWALKRNAGGGELWCLCGS